MDDRVLLDADIREPLFDYLEQHHGKVRFLEEKVTGKARADVVMVLPDKICGIEIKSDADSYTRLAAQVKNYDKYYDENYLVVGSTHALHAAEHVPAYWGIISVELIKGEIDFYRVRDARPNPKAKLKNKMSLLWKSEFSHILAENKMPKYNTRRRARNSFLRSCSIKCRKKFCMNRSVKNSSNVTIRFTIKNNV